MNIISDRAISRRTLLRGAGFGIALPLLNAMLPLSSLSARQPISAPAAPRRLAWMYTPNGVIGKQWFPVQTGKQYKLPPSLKPLESIRDQVNIVSGLRRVYLSGEPHSQAGSCWLTSAKPNERADGATAIDTTLDQLIASKVGHQTTFSSLELSCNQFVDKAEPKIFDSISWYGPGNDAKSISDPRQVFQRLFGKSAEIKTSVLDAVLEDANDLGRTLGREDQRKLDEYLSSVRSIEQRLSRQKLAKEGIGSIDFELPEKLPTNRGAFIRLMGDLMLLAFQTDQTRIATMMVGPERWETPQLYDGVFANPVNHHVMTHDHDFDEQVAKIDQFHVQQYAYLVSRMANIQEGDSTMLKNSCFILGSGIGDGAIHSYENLPLVMAGQLGGSLGTGQHFQAPQDTPLANLWLMIANKMGARIDEFADSTQPLVLNG